MKEHLSHSGNCHWARSLHAGNYAQEHGLDGGEVEDPMSDDLLAARKGTFEAEPGWPHEGKRGWKCKISKMVEAGWSLDPAPTGEGEEGDGVTCFYCNLSLDGWEPKDDPMEEHRRRSPECAFFALVEKFGGGADGKKGKAKGKGKAARSSKVSRLSTQSVLSTFSEAPSLADVGVGEEAEAGVDDSIVSTASQVNATGTTTKGKKKGGRPVAAAKGAKARSRANTVDSEADSQPLYPNLSSQAPSQPIEEDIIAVSQPPIVDAVAATVPAKKTTRKNAARQSKQPLDSSIIEISSLDMAPVKKATRGRKPKPQPEAAVRIRS